MRLQRQEAEAGWRELWQSLSKSAELDAQHYSQLEAASNRHHEWLLSDNRQTLRYHGEQPLPVKALTLPPLIVPKLSVHQLQDALRQQDLNTRQLTQRLQNNHAYHLLTRNCVTEIFRAVNQALGAETQHRLGGVIDENLNVVPFAAFDQVRTTYHVKNIVVLPSYRQQQLAKQYAQEFEPLVYVRESNILSANLYSHHPDDALFVFFTDDALLLRPLFGAFNVVAGFGQTLYGLLQWPFDNGELLATGTRGVLMSIPELAFINMRKGSYKFISQNSLPDDNLFSSEK